MSPPNLAHPGSTTQTRKSHSLLSRLAAIIGTVLVVVFGVYAVALSSSSIQQLQHQAQDSFVAQTDTLRDVVAQLDDALTQEASRFMRTLEATVPGCAAAIRCSMPTWRCPIISSTSPAGPSPPCLRGLETISSA